MEEIWRPVKGYEESYKISNMGYVKTLERVYYSGRYHNNAKLQEEKILRVSIFNDGYSMVILHKNGIKKGYSVHALVWDNFSDIPRTKDLQVDHINEDKRDNRFENLQLLPPKANRRKSLRRELPVGVVPHLKKFRSQITIKGECLYLGLYDTPEEAHEQYLKAEKLFVIN